MGGAGSVGSTGVKRVLCLLICMGSVFAQGQSAPRISNTLPPSENIRKPDLTIPGAAAEAASAMAYDPNGRYLAVTGSNNAVRVFDARPGSGLTAELSQTLIGHTAPVLAIGFKDTNSLVSVSLDQTIKIWDVASGKLLHSAALRFGDRLIPTLSPGKQPLLAGGLLNRVMLWDYQTGELLKTFEVNDSDVAALAFTPDGKLLVIGTSKGVVRLMDVATWKLTGIVDLDAPVHSLAVATNRILVDCADGTLLLLRMADDQNSIPEVPGEGSGAIAFSPNGDRFACGGANGIIRLWDSGSLKLLCQLQGDTAEVRSIAFSPDRQDMVSRSANGEINCWSLQSVPSGEP